MKIKNGKEIEILDESVDTNSDVSDDSHAVAKVGNMIRIEFPMQAIVWLFMVFMGILIYKKVIGVLIILFFSFILTSAFLPMYKFLIGKKVPKAVALFLMYFGLILLVILVSGGILIPTVIELRHFLSDLPGVMGSIANSTSSLHLDRFGIENDALRNLLLGYSKELSSNIIPALIHGYEGATATLHAVFGFVGGGVTAILMVLVLSSYSVIEHEYVVDTIVLGLANKKYSQLVRKLIANIETKLGRWLIGQVTLSGVVGFLSWLLLTIIGVPFVLPLALIAALLESIPSLGPIFAALPAILLAFVHGGLVEVFWVVLGYLIIQQLENNLIVPRIMGNAVGLHPVVIIIGIMFGFSIGNIIGASLAIPIIVILKLGLEFYYDLRKLDASTV